MRRLLHFLAAAIRRSGLRYVRESPEIAAFRRRVAARRHPTARARQFWNTVPLGDRGRS